MSNTHTLVQVSFKCAEKREREVWDLHSSSHLYASKRTHLHKHSHTHARRETRRGQSFYHWAEVFIYKLNHPDICLSGSLSPNTSPPPLSLYSSPIPRRSEITLQPGSEVKVSGLCYLSSPPLQCMCVCECVLMYKRGSESDLEQHMYSRIMLIMTNFQHS